MGPIRALYRRVVPAAARRRILSVRRLGTRIGAGLGISALSIKRAIDLAESAMDRKDRTEAARCWRAALDAAGRRAPARAFVGLGQALRFAGAFDAAEETANEGLRRHPQEVAIAVELAEIAMARRDWPEARIRWQAALDAGGASAPADGYLGMARVLQEIGDMEAAEAMAVRGLEAYPAHGPLAAKAAELAAARQGWMALMTHWHGISSARPYRVVCDLAQSALAEQDLARRLGDLRMLYPFFEVLAIDRQGRRLKVGIHGCAGGEADPLPQNFEPDLALSVSRLEDLDELERWLMARGRNGGHGKA